MCACPSSPATMLPPPSLPPLASGSGYHSFSFLHSFLLLLFPSLILNKFVRWLVRFEDRREATTLPLPLLMTTKMVMIWRRRQKQMGTLNTLSLGLLLFSRNNNNNTLSILSYRLLSSSHLSNFKYLNLVN